MSGKTRAYLDLIRAPNLVTAAADVLAGFYWGGGLLRDWPSLVLLIPVSMCLYAGGVVLNDVFDAAIDARERPRRPIPSGVVSRRAAGRLGTVLLVVGPLGACALSGRSFALAGMIAILALLYDSVLKRTVVAPLAMGSCRALNVALGVSAVGTSRLLEAGILVPMAAMALYVASITFFAREEAIVTSRGRLAMGTFGACCALGLMGLLPWGVNGLDLGFLWPLGFLTVTVGGVGFAAASAPSPETTQRTVRLFVMGIIVLDACIAWGARGPVAGAVVGALLLPALVMSRVLRVT